MIRILSNGEDLLVLQVLTRATQARSVTLLMAGYDPELSFLESLRKVRNLKI